MTIGKGTEIGERCRISIANSLEVGEKVLFSPNVYITDCDHEYRKIDTPVMEQGIVQNGQKVSIGEGSYIGINAVIVGNVKIGKHCVIGANSVVTKDVMDYCVVVGSPARIIKHIGLIDYDKKRVNKNNDAAHNNAEDKTIENYD